MNQYESENRLTINSVAYWTVLCVLSRNKYYIVLHKQIHKNLYLQVLKNIVFYIVLAICFIHGCKLLNMYRALLLLILELHPALDFRSTTNMISISLFSETVYSLLTNQQLWIEFDFPALPILYFSEPTMCELPG